MNTEKKLDTKAIIAEIQSRIANAPDPTTAGIRSIRREFSKRLAKESPDQIVAIALGLFQRPGFAHRFVAYELVCQHRQSLASLNAKLLERFGQGLDSWSAVDTYASYLSGPAWRENQVSDSVIHKWAKSKDRWWRRTALVSTVPLNNKARGGRGDTARTLEICQMLIDDRDDMVVKALSWALRELAKRDPKSVNKFLSENEGRIAALALREVNNKLKTGLKNPRQKSAAAE